MQQLIREYGRQKTTTYKPLWNSLKLHFFIVFFFFFFIKTKRTMKALETRQRERMGSNATEVFRTFSNP